jgi:pantothenate kinase
MLVKDIYGGDYSSQGLAGDLIASSFGKAMGCKEVKQGIYVYIHIHDIYFL